MSDFGAMRDRIDDELDRAGTIDNQIESAIQTAIEHYKYKRFWFNETTATSSTADGTEYYSHPAALLSIDSLRLDPGSGYYQLKPQSFDTLERWSQGVTQEGQPTHFATYKDQYRLFLIPDAIYTLQWAGVAVLDALADDTDTNAWMVEGEELIRQRAKAIVSLDVLREASVTQQALLLNAKGSECFSFMEEAALRALTNNNMRRVSTGRIRRAL